MHRSIRHYLDVVVVLAQKDLKVRYRNSVLGFLWSLLNPLAYMMILSLVFSLLLRVTIPNFPAWLLIGLLVWRFFAIGTGQGLMALVGNPSLVGKVYVSRYVLVLSNNVANFIGATLEFFVLLPVLVFFGVGLDVQVLFLPVILILEFLLVFSLSLSLAALNLRYRDFYQLWEIALQLGFFLSPIVYDANLIPIRYRPLYLLNPVTIIIGSVRDLLLFNRLPSISDLSTLIAGTAVLFLIGGLIFHSLEPKFAEEI